MNPYVQSFILSMRPVAELRGGIPLAVANDIPLHIAYIICVFANIMVIPVFYLFLETAHKLFYRIKPYRILFDKYVERTRRKADINVRKYGYWGIMLFVAIPLPITGAYTGTMAAWILKLNRKQSFWFLALGVLIAGLVVSIAVLTGLGIMEIFLKH